MIDTKFLEKFVPPLELKTLLEGTRGEEKQYFSELIKDLTETIKSVPPIGANEELGLSAPVKLHYFGGANDWWISELDKDDGIAFGYACINGWTDSAELGYVSIPELLEIRYPVEVEIANTGKRVETRIPIELDLYWKEKTLAEVIKSVQGK